MKILSKVTLVILGLVFVGSLVPTIIFHTDGKRIEKVVSASYSEFDHPVNLSPDQFEGELVFSGPPEEIGEIYGRFFSAEIRASVDQMRLFLSKERISSNFIANLTKSTEQSLVVDERLEIQAIAESAGVEFEDLIALNLMDFLAIDKSEGGCTSWIAVGSTTATGETLIHKNRDLALNPQVVVKFVREGKYSYTALVTAGVSSSVPAGINEYGLAAFQNDVTMNPLNYNPLGVGGTVFCRRILEECKNVDEAIAYIQEHACLGGSIFFLGDKEKGAIVERSGWASAVTLVENNLAYRANHFVNLTNGTYENPAPSTSSLRRFEAAQAFLEPRRGSLSVMDYNALSRHHYSPEAGEYTTHDHTDGSICNHHTLFGCTIQIDRSYPGDLSVIWAALGHPCSAIYTPIHVGASRIAEMYGTNRAWSVSTALFEQVETPGDFELLPRAFQSIEDDLVLEEKSVREQARGLRETGNVTGAANLLTNYDLSSATNNLGHMEMLLEIDLDEIDTSSSGLRTGTALTPYLSYFYVGAGVLVLISITIILRRRKNLQVVLPDESITRESSLVEERSPTERFVYASSLSRFVAWGFDAVIIAGLGLAEYSLCLVFVWFNPFSIQVSFFQTIAIGLVGFLLTGILYFIVMESFNHGQTLGKKILRIQSVDKETGIPGPSKQVLKNSLFKGNVFFIVDLITGLIRNAGKPDKQFRLSQDWAHIIVVKRAANRKK